MQTTQEKPLTRLQKPKPHQLVDFDRADFEAYATKYLRYASPHKSVDAFVLDRANEPVIRLLWDYFFNPTRFDAQHKGTYSSGKGLLILGNPGTGKTELMLIFSNLVKNQMAFGNTSFWTLLEAYQRNVTPKLMKGQHWCYDELGLDACRSFKSYGNGIDIDATLIQQRYHYFRQGFITHFTSNLTIEMMLHPSTGYDQRTVSRLKEMCNVITLEGKDRRSSIAPTRKVEEDPADNLLSETDILLQIQEAKQKNAYPDNEYILQSWFDIARKYQLLTIDNETLWTHLLEMRQAVYQLNSSTMHKMLNKQLGKLKAYEAFEEHYTQRVKIEQNCFEWLAIRQAKALCIKKYYFHES